MRFNRKFLQTTSGRVEIRKMERKIRTILLRSEQYRPEPDTILNLFEDLTMEECMTHIGNVARRINKNDRYHLDEKLEESPKTKTEFNNVLPYIKKIVAWILKTHPEHVYLIFGRDAELIYDALKITLLKTSEKPPVYLYPGSGDIHTRIKHPEYFKIDTTFLKKFLGHFQITKSKIKEHQRFLTLDTGFEGSIARVLMNLCTSLYGPESLKLFSNNLISCTAKHKESHDAKPGPVFQSQAAPKINFPKTYSVIKSRNFNKLLAVSLQLMPRYHEEYENWDHRGHGVPFCRKRRPNQTDIDWVSRPNDSIINPVAAMYFQLQTVRYFYLQRELILGKVNN